MIQIRTKDFPRLSYNKTGQGPAIVLLHGFPANSSLWKNLDFQLLQDFTIISPDLPGSGESSYDGENLSMELMAESVANILDHEGITNALIVGHSMGGYAALAFADKFPEKLKGLSLLHSTALADTDGKKEARTKSINIIRNGGINTFINQMIPNLFSDGFKQIHPEIVAQQIEGGLKNTADSLIATYYAIMNRSDRVEVLKKAAYPVQLLIGKKDNLLPYDKSLQQSYLADVNFVSVYNNSGHMSMLECPEILSADIYKFAKYCYS